MSVASSVDVDTRVVLEALEGLAPPCEYSMHEPWGHTEPAVWAVWVRTPPCGHSGKPNPVLLCNPCWEALRGALVLMCKTCGHTFSAIDWLVKVERI